MRVHVLCFGVLKDLLGRDRDLVELGEGADVQSLISVLRERIVFSEKVWSTLAVAVNREYAGLQTILRDGDEVALLPPVSGGAGIDPSTAGWSYAD